MDPHPLKKPLQKMQVERYEKALIASLGSELQPLEMPGVALFTLVVGLMLTTFIGSTSHKNCLHKISQMYSNQANMLTRRQAIPK